MHCSLFDPHTAGLLIHVRNRLFPALAATLELDHPWTCADRCLLQCEPAGDHLLVTLAMPERHLDLLQLTRLLMLPGQGWPLPLAAGLDEATLQPQLFVRLPLAIMDEEVLLQAIGALQQARQRWLAWPPVTTPGGSGVPA